MRTISRLIFASLCIAVTLSGSGHFGALSAISIASGADDCSQPVRIEFSLRNAELYSFWTEPYAPSNL